MKIKTLSLLLVLVYSLGAMPLHAAQPLCENFDPEPPHFKALYQSGKELGRAICRTFGKQIEPGQLKAQFVAFARKASESTASAFATTAFAQDMQVQMQNFETLANAGVDKGNLPSFETINDNSNFDAVYFRFTSSTIDGNANLEDPGCRQSGGASCAELFESLKVAIEQYKKPVDSLAGSDLSVKAGLLMQDWDRYFEIARPQTLWDALFTTVLEQDHLAQDRLVGPMDKQWFVVHPSIVIENISSAEDGDNLSAALAIEWVGVNWWNADTSPIGYPFGVSLASVYSDRVEVEEVGHGLMLHFGNSISLGWTDHDGDDGWLVTVDFLSLMARKKQHWESYKANLEAIFEAEKQAILGADN